MNIGIGFDIIIHPRQRKERKRRASHCPKWSKSVAFVFGEIIKSGINGKSCFVIAVDGSVLKAVPLRVVPVRD